MARQSDAELDAVVVGAGFAGLYMLHRLRSMGFRGRVLEAGQGVGGTPEAAGEQLKREIARWAQVAKEAGIKPVD